MLNSRTVSPILLICLCLLAFSVVLIGHSADAESGPTNAGAYSPDTGICSSYGRSGKITEVDILKDHSVGSGFNTSTILSALSMYGTKSRVVFILKPGFWKIEGVLEIPANITLRLQEGAVFSLGYGSRIILDGPIQAGIDQIFIGSGKVLFRQNRQDVYPNWWKSHQDRFFSSAIQKALASGARSVFFPRGVYEVDIRKEYQVQALVLPSNIRVYGEGDKSVIRLVETPRTEGTWAAYEMFSGKDITNVEISGLTFDAEKFYPDPETTSRLDSSIKGTRAIGIRNVDECKIIGCYFKGFTNGSAYITGKNIIISHNRFYHGSYRTQTIRLDKSKFVTVSENIFEDIGPHYYMVLGRPDETSSVDVIMVGYEVEIAYITKNKITNTAANGIRIENSKNVHVIGNIISNVGEDGIIFYRKTVDCDCRENVVSNWGKLNNFAFIRRQNGKIYNPKEYHYLPPKSPQLPKSLNDAETWELNRYYMQGRDQSTIPEYDPSDYKHILAFRGFSAIAVTELSERIAIIGNHITGNTSKTYGLYNYASNYGINIGTASINPPTTSGDCIVSNNIISGCIDYDIYSPQYVDLASKSGTPKPSLVFGNKCDPAKILVYNNKAKSL